MATVGGVTGAILSHDVPDTAAITMPTVAMTALVVWSRNVVGVDISAGMSAISMSVHMGVSMTAHTVTGAAITAVAAHTTVAAVTALTAVHVDDDWTLRTVHWDPDWDHFRSVVMSHVMTRARREGNVDRDWNCWNDERGEK